MPNIVIFGPPGSGKGTQSEFIINKYKLGHISTGDVLRTHISEQTELGVKAKEFINQGQLVPDELIIDMLSVWLDANSNDNGYIFDGFPRTMAQAQALKVMLGKKGQDIDLMLSLEVHKEELITRLVKRGESSGRSDDNLETIEKRIQVYNEQTSPVIDFYIAEKTHAPIHGIGSMDAISALIAAEFDNL